MSGTQVVQVIHVRIEPSVFEIAWGRIELVRRRSSFGNGTLSQTRGFAPGTHTDIVDKDGPVGKIEPEFSKIGLPKDADIIIVFGPGDHQGRVGTLVA